MKIKRVKISGYRSIANPIEIQLPQICALIGANNTGKSNIMSAIFNVLGKDWVTVNTFAENDVFKKEYDRDIEIEIEFVESYQYQQYVGIDPIPIPKLRFFYTRYKVGENAGQRRLEKQCLDVKDKPVMVLQKKPKKGEAHQYQPLTTIPQSLQESMPVIYIGLDRTLKNQLPYARNSLLGALLNEVNKDFMRPENKVVVKDENGNDVELSRVDEFNKCINAAIKILKTKEFAALEKSIKNNALLQLGFDPELDLDKFDVFFNPLTSLDFYKSLSLYVQEHDFRIDATELGGGFQNALIIAIIKAFEERKKQGALFLIEEPEMFLHPQMQRSLYKTLRKIGETNQIIYITHSPHFVTIPEFNEIVMVNKDAEGTKVLQSSLKPDARLIEKFRKELDPERNELFFAKRLLIVEGDTEKLALPEYAKRLKLDFDRVGGSIIEVGGKRNLIDFLELAISFKIPTGIIYDIDSKDFQSNEKTEEAEYNKTLNGYSNKGIKVWSFNKNYEEELSKAFGASEYQKLCQKFEKVSKTIRARLIANDENTKIPDFVTPIVKWLANAP